MESRPVRHDGGIVGVERKQVVIDMVLISLQSFSWTVRGANIHTFRSYTRGRKGEIDTNTFWSYTQGRNIE